MANLSDPAHLEVLHNALAGIADGMALTVVRTSRSSIVRSGFDFSTGLLNSKGELVGQGMCQPIHIGGMMPALEACLDYYKENVHPGDVFINNDPYSGGVHLPDIFIFKPIFVGDVLLGYGCAMAHHTDIGGRVPGGNACDSTEIYQEGLRIPPIKLYQRGEPNETMFRILEKAVRVPDKVIGDILAQMAALTYGEGEILALAERIGVEELVSGASELVDYTERLTRMGIRRLPDGEWSFTDYIDDDGIEPGPIAIVIHVAKKDDEIHVDFTGTSPQCKGAIQPTLNSTKSAVYAAVRTVLGGNIPNTGGYFRPVTVTAPLGSFVNPLLPAPVAARALGWFRITHTVFGAFAQLLPDKIYAGSGGCEYIGSMGGYHKDKTPWKAWVQIDSMLEAATGGFSDRDGMDGQGGPVCNVSNIPVETLEMDQPIRIEEYALLPDSEGAGKFRGGVGLTRQYRYMEDDTIVQVRSDRRDHTPYGLYGGHPSGPCKITFKRDGEEQAMPTKFLVTAKRGEIMRLETPGGGGWGDPLERDPEMVLADVIAEKVMPQRARQTYGVVLDVEKRQVDWSATERLRKEMRQQQPESQGQTGTSPSEEG